MSVECVTSLPSMKREKWIAPLWAVLPDVILATEIPVSKRSFGYDVGDLHRRLGRRGLNHGDRFALVGRKPRNGRDLRAFGIPDADRTHVRRHQRFPDSAEADPHQSVPEMEPRTMTTSISPSSSVTAGALDVNIVAIEIEHVWTR